MSRKREEKMAMSVARAEVRPAGRVLKIVALATAAILGLNGLWMVVDAGSWYALVPGVSDTGPINGHFVRDIGAAYLAAALSLGLSVNVRAGGRALAWAAFVFLGLHYAEHVADVMAARLPFEHLIGDIPAVGLPAIVALWAALALPKGDAR
jgi:hypothetical protein